MSAAGVAAVRPEAIAPARVAVFNPVLRRLRDDSVRLFGSSQVTLCPLWNEERPFSYLMRVEVRGAAGETCGRLFVKVSKPKVIDGHPDGMQRRVARDFEVTRRLHEQLVGHSAHGVVKPVACYPDLLTLVTEEVAGVNLLDFLTHKAAWLPGEGTLQRLERTMHSVGVWVRTFQACSDGFDSEHFSVDALKSYVDLRLGTLVQHVGSDFSPDDRRQVLAWIDRQGEQVGDGDLVDVPIHGDLAPANVLVSSDRIVVLDFAMARRGNVFHDITRLFLQVDLLRLKPYYRAAVVRRLTAALLEGFAPGLTPDRPMVSLLLMQHRINHLATLVTRRERFPGRVYSARVIAEHRRWLSDTLESGCAAGELA